MKTTWTQILNIKKMVQTSTLYFKHILAWRMCSFDLKMQSFTFLNLKEA